MTAPSDAAPPAPRLRTTARVRFLVAFLAGLIAALALGAGALYGYDRQYEGRILPGVHVGSVDLSGLSPAAAAQRLEAAYADLSRGELVLTAAGGQTVVRYADVGRRLDVEGLVAEAVAIGHSGSPLERVIGNAKTAIRGIELAPRIVFERDRLATRIRATAAGVEVAPVDATVTLGKSGFSLTPSKDGRTADADVPTARAIDALGELDAPSRIEVPIPVATIEPNVTTPEAITGRSAAERIARDIDVTVGDDHWTIRASTIRTWLRLTPTVDGRYVPVLQIAGIRPVLERIATNVKRNPKNASFLVGKGSVIVGVTAGRDGRELDIDATARDLAEALIARGGRIEAGDVDATIAVTRPTLTTEEAEKAAPLMKRISTWTTYFPIGIKNGFGANIWIPAKLINGYVVGPGETFDFWRAVGPVTRAKGFTDGGAIINGKTEPQGALAGGICSCSTTLFNSALRAGFKMGARRNHYYYIDRYPLGLDATVFISASGSTQTMSWTNDTKYPVLIRGINTRDGNRGFVRFDLYSVPTGRTVSFTKPIVKNVRPARDTIQYTSTLPAGQRERIEYPVDGKDVWVTRIVRDASGRIIHTDPYYSHYSRVDGIVLVGTGGSTPTPSPSPSPSP